MTTTTADVAGYAAAVRAALADLAPGDRDDLLADLDDHLAEVAEEADEPLEARLGPPRAYAAELRAAAGLPPAGPAPGPGRPSTLRRAADGTAAFLPELLPVWWVARGLLLAWAVARPVAGNAGVLLLALLLVPASVLLGLRTRADRGLRWAGYTASLAALVLAFLVAGVTTVESSSETYGRAPEVAVAPPPDLGTVTNLYPYAKDGTPLTDVQLFDQDGNPVRLEADLDPAGNPITRITRRTADGQDIENVYPQRQTVGVPTADGSTREQPVQPPTVRAPTLTPN